MALPPASSVPAFHAPYAEDDGAIAARMLPGSRISREREQRIDKRARDLIAAIRARSAGLVAIEDTRREYALSTKEGLALMVLAEAL